MKEKIKVKDIEISIKSLNSEKYISLTDIAKKKNRTEPMECTPFVLQ
jgi:hypothetical protein